MKMYFNILSSVTIFIKCLLFLSATITSLLSCGGEFNTLIMCFIIIFPFNFKPVVVQFS